jgi:hypothetical protein
MELCFTSAWLVLATSRLLLRAGLIMPADAAISLRWSARLTEAGMRRWRHRRACLRR